MAGISTHDRDYGQRAIVAHVQTERPHEHTAWQRFLPGVLPRRLVFRQGDEVGRPGRVDIELRAGEGPDPIHAWVGGAATVIVRGELEVG